MPWAQTTKPKGKEYRILCSDVAGTCIVNVKIDGVVWCGYTSKQVAYRDMQRLEETYPHRKFMVAEYLELPVKGG